MRDEDNKKMEHKRGITDEDEMGVHKKAKLDSNEEIEELEEEEEIIEESDEEKSESLGSESESDGETDDLIPLSLPQDILLPKWNEDDFVNSLATAWEKLEPFEEDGVELEVFPFRYCSIDSFLPDEELIEEITAAVSRCSFKEKSSDLFHFRQTKDLKAIPRLESLTAFFSDKVGGIVKKITQLPLSGETDMFCSHYSKSDFLLCHDDELEKRRIAFMYYLTPWEAEFGGTLDLFESDELGNPTSIVKKLCPKRNKLIFFEVTARSFHQVSEVIVEEDRIALSGWFYGDALPRPPPTLPPPPTFIPLPDALECQDVEKEFEVSELYKQPESFTELNQKIVEDNHILLAPFLSNELLEEIKEKAKEITWSKIGPPNVRNYSEGSILPNFSSISFIKFLEKLTEFELKEVSWSMRKFQQGSYKLVHGDPQSQMSQKEEATKNDSETKKGDVEKKDEGALLDVLFFFGIDEDWDEEWGGLTAFIDAEGDQLASVWPIDNSLAIVVRDESVVSCVSLLTHSAPPFFIFSATFKAI